MVYRTLAAIGADLVVYNDLEDLEESIRSLNPTLLQNFDSSCFNGHYVTPEVTPALLRDVEESRGRGRLSASVSLRLPCGDGNGKGGEDPNIINILVREGEEEEIDSPTITTTTTALMTQATAKPKTSNNASSPSSIRSCESIQNLNPGTPSAKRMRTSDL